MKRLTHKKGENQYYAVKEENNAIYNKLGRLEDLMEKYVIEDVKQLERIITEYVLPQPQPQLKVGKNLYVKEANWIEVKDITWLVDLITKRRDSAIDDLNMPSPNCDEAQNQLKGIIMAYNDILNEIKYKGGK